MQQPTVHFKHIAMLAVEGKDAGEQALEQPPARVLPVPLELTARLHAAQGVTRFTTRGVRSRP